VGCCSFAERKSKNVCRSQQDIVCLARCPKKHEVRDFVSFVPDCQNWVLFSNQVPPLAFKSLLELKLFTRARAKIKNHFFLKLKNAKHFNSSVWSPKHYVFNQDKN
jgi:hypothetical protein